MSDQADHVLILFKHGDIAHVIGPITKPGAEQHAKAFRLLFDSEYAILPLTSNPFLLTDAGRRLLTVSPDN